LVARAIHRMGWRLEEPFVKVNIGDLNPNVIESELFGHEKGAFTGATERRIGRIEKANGGVLFLDEIGDLPQEIQIKLLRFLEERVFSRTGSSDEIKVDVQIVAATNQNLEAAIEKGRFREDLYFRLKSFEIWLPPLRERKEDIPLLAEHFLNLFKREGRSDTIDISQEALNNLTDYDWPGNIRELRMALERAVIYSKNRGHSKIDLEDLPLELISKSRNSVGQAIDKEREQVSLDEELARTELRYIEDALRQAGGKKGEAWKLLGLNDRFALRRRVKNILKRYPHLVEEYSSIAKAFPKTS